MRRVASGLSSELQRVLRPVAHERQRHTGPHCRRSRVARGRHRDAERLVRFIGFDCCEHRMGQRVPSHRPCKVHGDRLLSFSCHGSLPRTRSIVQVPKNYGRKFVTIPSGWVQTYDDYGCTIKREPEAVPRLSRVCVVIAVLFTTADAGLCPFLCLFDDSAAHEASNVPAHVNSCGGTCSSASTAVTLDVHWRPAVPASRVPRPETVPLCPAPTFDIDHPPRLAASVHA